MTPTPVPTQVFNLGGDPWQPELYFVDSLSSSGPDDAFENVHSKVYPFDPERPHVPNVVRMPSVVIRTRVKILKHMY